MGYGTYSMSEMKSLQEELLLDFPAGAKITANFPGYWFYELKVTTIAREKFVVGANILFGSTGGRIHYSDYSGEISSNQLVNYFSVGSPLALKLKNTDDAFQVYLNLKPQLYISRLSFEFYSRLGTQYDDDLLEFSSVNLGIEPGLTFQRMIRKWGFDLSLGYNLNLFRGKLIYSENDQAHLQNQSGQDIHLDMSGLRISLGVICRIDNKHK